MAWFGARRTPKQKGKTAHGKREARADELYDRMKEQERSEGDD